MTSEEQRMLLAGKLIGLSLVLCENKGIVPNWEYSVELLRDAAFAITKFKGEVHKPALNQHH